MYVIDTRESGDNTRRSYRCKECEERITTIETKVIGPRGAAAWAKRRKDAKLFIIHAMDLKVSITQLANDAQKLLGK